MRKLIAIAIMSAALLASGAARAQTYDPNYPICLHTYGPVGNINCRYVSLDQCRFNATGRSADCEINPYFKPTAPAARRPRRRAH